MLRLALLLSFLSLSASVSGSAQAQVDSMAAVREIRAALGGGGESGRLEIGIESMGAGPGRLVSGATR